MDKCIPRATIPPRRNRPWLSKKLIQAIRRKNILYKRVTATNDFSKYKSYRNRVTGELRNAKKAFFRKLNPKRSREFWKVYKALNNSSSSIPVLILGDSIAKTNKEKAELLNKFFVSCFNTSHTPLQDSDPKPECSGDISEDMLCSEESVCELLLSLDVSKSCGPDGISAQMLKHTAINIAPAVTSLFNLSLKKGETPRNWKESRVVPIPKVLPASKSPDNYRPISLLSILSKLLEKHICNLIVKHLHMNGVLSDRQWGFRAGRSILSALISTTMEWFTSLESGKISVQCSSTIRRLLIVFRIALF